ncbi:MAG TPA: VWA domain-containing protein [Pyrinomonadaceae bacterium]|nr:VWA domain-containing protein [Pyrinomonadaceae bacterium]
MSRIRLSLLTAATCLCLLLFSTLTSGQTKPEAKPDPSGDAQDVIKFDTSLVQTDVMVFDKNGRFADGLKAEQFQLKINKTQREISFFEIIRSGGITRQREETAQANPSSEPEPVKPPKTDSQRRAVIFFVDDLHLAPDSLARTRKSLLDFIDRGIREGDLVAITSPSGQIGFLQQFTADREALRSAVARLNYRTNTKSDMLQPPMSEYIAMKIREGDEQALTYYIQEIQKQACTKAGNQTMCTISPQAARQQVRMRAQQMVVESAPATDDTLRLLEGLMRTAAQIPGRKLVFVISDGFYLTDVKTGAIDRIKKVTDAAGRAGVVIYTLDARGIINEGVDVTNNRPISPDGKLTFATIGEISASQDGLNALAKDTGGQAFRNTNQPMAKWVEKVIDETSNYYLLAWKPDTEEQKRGKFKNIEISIVGRPDLTVRVRSSYFKSAALPLLTTKKKADKDPAKAREGDMRLVIDAPVSQRDIATDVDLRFVQMPGFGTRVIATISIDESMLSFDHVDGKLAADVDIGGICYDDKGKPLDSFVGRLRIFPRSANDSTTTGASKQKRSIYRFTTLVPGGLYQVRVGIRDLKSSRIGSAMDWITVPKI